MKKVIHHVFFALPLLWYAYIWIGTVFNIEITLSSDITVFYNSDPHPEDPPQKGFLPDWTILILVFFVTPFSFITGTIYTFYRKYWWWLSAYMVLGGIPVLLYVLGIFLNINH